MTPHVVYLKGSLKALNVLLYADDGALMTPNNHNHWSAGRRSAAAARPVWQSVSLFPGPHWSLSGSSKGPKGALMGAAGRAQWTSRLCDSSDWGSVCVWVRGGERGEMSLVSRCLFRLRNLNVSLKTRSIQLTWGSSRRRLLLLLLFYGVMWI